MARSNEHETPESVSSPEPTGPNQPDQANPEPLPKTPSGLAAMVIRIFQSRSEWLTLAILLVIVVGAVALILMVVLDKAKSTFLDLSQKQMEIIEKVSGIQDRSIATFDKKTQEAEEAREKNLSAAETYRTKTNELTEKEEELKRELKEVEEQKTRLSKENEALRQKAQEFERLKTDNMELAKAILQLAQSPDELATKAPDWGGVDPQEIYRIAEQTRDVYFPGEEHAAVRSLIRFAKEPNQRNFKALRKLAGMGQEELERILQKGLGFETWVKAIFPPARVADSKGRESPEAIYFGVQDFAYGRYTGYYGWRNVILIRVVGVVQDENLTQWQATDVAGYSLLSLVTVQDIRDWYIKQTYVVGVEFEKQDMAVIRKVQPVKGNEGMSNKDKLFTLPRTSDLARGTYYVLFGEIREFNTQTPSRLKENEPTIYSSAIVNEGEEFAQSLRMSERAEKYSVPAKHMRALEAMQVPKAIRRIYEDCLCSAARENYEYALYKITPGQCGRLAALALNESLSIADVLRSGILGDVYRIIVGYEELGMRGKQFAMLEFSTLDGALRDFQDPYAYSK